MPRFHSVKKHWHSKSTSAVLASWASTVICWKTSQDGGVRVCVALAICSTPSAGSKPSESHAGLYRESWLVSAVGASERTADTGIRELREHGCVPIKLYVRTPKFNFVIIFTCHNIEFFSFFSNHLKKSEKKIKHSKQKQEVRGKTNRKWATSGPRAIMCGLCRLF